MKVSKKYAIISLFLLVSCTKKQEVAPFKKDFVDCVKSYISQDSSRHDSYVIFSAKDFYNEMKKCEGMLVGPLYEGIFPKDKEKQYVWLMNYGTSSVYFYYSEAVFFDYPSIHSVKYSKQDSVILYGNTYTKSPAVNYLKRANLFHYRGDKLCVEKNVDSIFLPRIEVDPRESAEQD